MKKCILLFLIPISSLAQVDLAIDSSFHRMGVGGPISQGLDYYHIPENMVDTVQFSALVSNYGVSNANGVHVELNIAWNSSIIETFISDTVALCSGCSDSIIFQDYFVPQQNGQYEYFFEIFSDSLDIFLPNNTDTNYCQVSWNPGPYRRDNGEQGAPNFDWYNNGNPLEIGNVYQAFDDLFIQTAHINITADSSNVGQLCYAVLYKWDGIQFVYEEMTSDYQITAGDLDNEIWLIFPYQFCVLEGEVFLFSVGHYGGANPVQFITAQKVDKGTTIKSESGFLDSLDTSFAIMSYPIVKYSDDCVNGFESGELKKLLQLFPNPATNQTSIEFDTAQPSSAQISIIDMQGKLIFEKTLSNLNAGKHTEPINTEKIAPGIYNVFVQMDEHVASGQMIIEH